MTSKTISQGILRAIGVLVGIAILLYFLYTIQSVLAYLAIAAVVALIGSPLVRFFRKIKLPNILAVILTMLLMVGVLAGIIALFIPLLSEQGKNLSLLDIDELQTSLNTLYHQITNHLGLSSHIVEDVIDDAGLEKIFYKVWILGSFLIFLIHF